MAVPLVLGAAYYAYTRRGSVPSTGDKTGTCAQLAQGGQLDLVHKSYADYTGHSLRHPTGYAKCGECDKNWKFHHSLIPGTKNYCSPPSGTALQLSQQQQQSGYAQGIPTALPVAVQQQSGYAQGPMRSGGRESKQKEKKPTRVRYTKSRSGGGRGERYYKIAIDGTKTRLTHEEYKRRKKTQERRGGKDVEEKLAKKKASRIQYTSKRSGGGGGTTKMRHYKTDKDGKRVRISKAEFQKGIDRQKKLDS